MFFPCIIYSAAWTLKFARWSWYLETIRRLLFYPNLLLQDWFLTGVNSAMRRSWYDLGDIFSASEVYNGLGVLDRSTNHIIFFSITFPLSFIVLLMLLFLPANLFLCANYVFSKLNLTLPSRADFKVSAFYYLFPCEVLFGLMITFSS